MTDLEIVENFINLQKTKFYSEEKEVRKAYEDFCKVAEYDDCEATGELVEKWGINSLNDTFPSFDLYLGRTNAECISRDNQYMDYLEHSWTIYYQECLFCSTESLERITEDVQEQYEVVANEKVAEYFLINPRKDVVEWALKHKDELGIKNVKREFIEQHQAIPELKEMILNNLYEKEGIK